ncbi:MAG: hypothetical protein R2759_03010 [Bacteroidales bacterium]
MKRTFIILLFVSLITHVFAQVLEPVKWSYNKTDLGDNNWELTFTASIDEHWHLYSQEIPEGGPEKTAFYFYDIDGFELLDKNIEIIEEESFTEENNLDYIIPFTRTRWN